MKKYNILGLILFVLVILSSCKEKLAEIELPKGDAKLVVFCFLSPDDSTVDVEVTRSAPIYGNSTNVGDLNVYNAVVTISDTLGHTITVPFNAAAQKYRISQTLFPILPGLKYTVSASGMGKNVSASTTVPTTIINFDKAEAKLISNTTEDGKQYAVTISWKDEPGKVNYYRIHLEAPTAGGLGSDTFPGGFADAVYKDEQKDGGSFADEYDYYQWNNDPIHNTQKVYLYLLNTDIHYYEYHRRRLNYFGDDPFSEPFQQYSNVDGGLGVVSSFRKSRVVIEI